MFVYIAICTLLTIFYAVIMALYHRYWVLTSTLNTSKDFPQKSVSVIIPVRNESENIALLLEDLLAQDYPQALLEIIVVDDFSDDNTATLVKQFPREKVKLIALKDFIFQNEIIHAYKKKALEVGIQQAQNEIILTTDGDCRVHKDWVKTMMMYQSISNSKLLTGAVIMNHTDTLFEKFQALDFLGMMGITAAMLKMKIFNMANGANLLYEKKGFEEVKGFEGINQVASGDDMLLIYKFALQYNQSVGFAKHPSAVVYTSTEKSLRGFLRQRFRWTAKSKDYQDKRMTFILGLVFLFVCTLVFNFFGLFFSKTLCLLFFIQLVVKSVSDYRLLKSTSSYYHREDLMKSFWSSQFFHILYIVVVGSLGNLLNFEWKGRKQRK